MGNYCVAKSVTLRLRSGQALAEKGRLAQDDNLLAMPIFKS